MVTHDSQVASHTERVVFLKDGKISKEREGLLLNRKREGQLKAKEEQEKVKENV